MRRLLLCILLVSSCWAQVQGNLPRADFAAQDGIIGGTGGVITWPENVALNSTLVCGINTPHDGTSTYSIADSLGNTWTTSALTNTGGTNPVDVWLTYTKSGSSGADTVTLTRLTGTGFMYLQCADIPYPVDIDGSLATATAAGSVTPTTITTTNTTSTNNDLLISVTAGAYNGSHTASPGDTELLSSEGTASPSISVLLSLKHAGVAGSNSATNYIWGGVSNQAMATLAFKPSTILITDTVMPDGGVGVAYSAQLHGIGGTAAQTYSCTGLPANGLSLNTSTGVISGANPTAGTVSTSCTTTDGVHTSSAAALTITIGTLGTPDIRTTNTTWSGDNVPSTVTVTGVHCGDAVIIFARGDDTHGSQSWVQAASGANNYVHHSLAGTVRRLETPIPGNVSWPIATYIINETQSGSDTFTITNNQNGSSGRKISNIYVISGGNVVDVGAFTNSDSSVASGSLNASYTTVVPNTMLLVASDTPSTTTSFSVNAPFLVDSTGGDIQGLSLYANTLVSSASSVTATTSWTGGSTSNQQYDTLIIPVRPAITPASCPLFVGAGEKIRRQIF